MTFVFSVLTALTMFTELTGAEEPWKSGSARIKITPTEYIWMSGYGNRDRPAEGKLTDLWAKATVLEDPRGHQAVLITLDLVGIHRQIAERAFVELSARYQLAREQIAFCCSHTHTGPVVGHNLDPLHYRQINATEQKKIDRFTRVLNGQIVEVVDRAMAKKVACKLTWGSGTSTFAVNRRQNRPEAEVPQRRVAGTLTGPFDHDVPVLAVHDMDGNLKTVVFGYACHATVLSFYQWSGDYPGFAQIELEKSHPGCLAMFWAGCGADQNPLPRRTVELAQHYGRRLADAVDAVLLTSQMTEVVGTLQTAYREIDLAFDDLPTKEDLERQAQSGNRFEVARANMLLEQVNAGQPLQQNYPYPVSLWKIGDDIQFISLGGEVVVDFAIRLKAELAGMKTWVAGYSNDVMAYIPSRRVLIEGGYEGEGAMVYYGLPTKWSLDVEESIVREVHRQIQERKN